MDLTVQSVDALRRERQPVSFGTVPRRSRDLDPDGRGVSESAIRRNPDALAYFQKHQTWPRRGRRATPRRGEVVRTDAPTVVPAKIDRDVGRAHRRHQRRTKGELIDRLLAIEQAYAELHLQHLAAADDVLVSERRAQRAELQLRDLRPEP